MMQDLERHRKMCLDLYGIEPGKAKTPSVVPGVWGPFTLRDELGRSLGGFARREYAYAWGIFIFANERRATWIQRGTPADGEPPFLNVRPGET